MCLQYPPNPCRRLTIVFFQGPLYTADWDDSGGELLGRWALRGRESRCAARWPDDLCGETPRFGIKRVHVFTGRVFQQSQQDSRIDRFGEEKVSAGVPGHLDRVTTRHLVARMGEHNHRDFSEKGVASDSLAEFKTVHPGQVDVNDDGVGWLRFAMSKRSRTATCAEDAIAGGAEVTFDRSRGLRIAIDDKYVCGFSAHGLFPFPPTSPSGRFTFRRTLLLPHARYGGGRSRCIPSLGYAARARQTRTRSFLGGLHGLANQPSQRACDYEAFKRVPRGDNLDGLGCSFVFRCVR